MLSRHSVETYPGNELTRNSSRIIRSQSFQLAEPLRTDPDVESDIGVRELISTWKNSAGGEYVTEPSPSNPRRQGKNEHHKQKEHAFMVQHFPFIRKSS